MAMFSKLKQFKNLRDQAKKVQDVLGQESVEGTAAWGKIKITMTGNQQVTVVSIDPELLKDQKKAEDAVKDAINDAMKKVHRVMADKMKNMGGLNNLLGGSEKK
ncbi:MAG: hypothetical protein UX10_C0001G0049 [Candidatus Magasanikbacteria bacterium GW2011_GWA2_45_39]|uniref:Nucleoid-associated protein UX10_C0001G0049 n=1 Tax=Candidatus Magasanikbacteria bacterium GW2011_GWA2_45_39 TaxID=1619041 RepID=A0A0G1QHZ2_9BACT|nr:MAG: hypothetical protein UX10_C0001G0049 [Candidatus Magasanikbacteria bacterium GW2011_GWA2_45_39]HBW74011.1 nucleoid-associated protein, YbaB/EbfC family [Candidatus Magasanikbacteria bacterium]